MITYSSLSELSTVSASQMRSLDRLSESRGFILIQMMENAGRSLAEVSLRIFQPKKVAVLVGPGGNGGGAMVAARHLNNQGIDVEVFESSSFSERTGIPAFQANILSAAGVRQHIGAAGFFPDKFDLIIDGLLGYSIDGPPRAQVRELIEIANASKTPIISLDVPSGIDPDSGSSSDVHIKATATLTLAAIKQGLTKITETGELFLADIGIPRVFYEELGIAGAAPRVHLSKISA